MLASGCRIRFPAWIPVLGKALDTLRVASSLNPTLFGGSVSQPDPVNYSRRYGSKIGHPNPLAKGSKRKNQQRHTKSNEETKKHEVMMIGYYGYSLFPQRPLVLVWFVSLLSHVRMCPRPAAWFISAVHLIQQVYRRQRRARS